VASTLTTLTSVEKTGSCSASARRAQHAAPLDRRNARRVEENRIESPQSFFDYPAIRADASHVGSSRSVRVVKWFLYSWVVKLSDRKPNEFSQMVKLGGVHYCQCRDGGLAENLHV
jgi:hypothetical protein